MKDKVILVEMLYEKAEQYVKTTLEVNRLKTIDKVTDVFASVASRFAILAIIALFFVLLTVGMALFLGELLGKNYYGFFALALFYGVMALVFIKMRKPWLDDKLNNYLINEIFKEKKNASN